MAGSQLEARGLFAGLFDFGFTAFITLKFLRVIYAILMVLIVLGGLFFFLALASRGAAAILLALIVVPLVTLLYLIFARISMELIALLFRIGENTSIMAARAQGHPGGGAGSAPPDPQPGGPGSGSGYGPPGQPSQF